MNILDEVYRPKIGVRDKAALDRYFKTFGDNPTEEWLDIEDIMTERGWTKIGEGQYATCYTKPNYNYVLKVNYTPDPAYEKYTSIIKQFRNKHFPIISDSKTLTVNELGQKYNMCAYLIEKLNPLPEFYDGEYALFVIGAKMIMKNPQLPSSELRREIEKIRAIYQYDEDYFPEILFSDKSLLEACRIVGRFSKIFYYNIDIHPANIMVRNNGTFVITDPYV
jgi:hypothetical protein